MRLGISQSPEGRRCFQRMTVRENLELGAYLRRDANVSSDIERVFDLFPRLREREKPEGRHDVGRRAADARDGPRADGRSVAAAARRALDGPRADPRRPHLRDGRARSTSRARRSCWWSRTRTTRSRCRRAATCSRRAGWCWPTSPRRYAITPKSRTRTWGLSDERLRTARAEALWLLYAWLISAIVASYLSGRKGYGERPGSRAGCCSTRSGSSSGWLSRRGRTRCGRSSGRSGAGRKRRRETRSPRGGCRRGPARPTEPPSRGPPGPGTARGPGPTRASAPPSPARGVTLHHTISSAGVVDDEPVGVAEEAGPRLALHRRRLELRREGDAVVAARPVAGSALGCAATGGASGTAGTLRRGCRRRSSPRRRARGRPPRSAPRPAATSTARCASGSSPARSGGAVRADRTGVAGQPRALRGLERGLAAAARSRSPAASSRSRRSTSGRGDRAITTTARPAKEQLAPVRRAGSGRSDRRRSSRRCGRCRDGAAPQSGHRRSRGANTACDLVALRRPRPRPGILALLDLGDPPPSIC